MLVFDQKALARVEVRGIECSEHLNASKWLPRAGPCYSYSLIMDYTAVLVLDQPDCDRGILRMRNSHGDVGRRFKSTQIDEYNELELRCRK